MFFRLHVQKQVDAKFIYMQIYIPFIYCRRLVFKIADICLEVMDTNLMKIKKKLG